jgi:hypothetical protein
MSEVVSKNEREVSNEECTPRNSMIKDNNHLKYCYIVKHIVSSMNPRKDVEPQIEMVQNKVLHLVVISNCLHKRNKTLNIIQK